MALQYLEPLTNRPRVLTGNTYKFQTGCGNLYITINTHPGDGRPVEVFSAMGKTGGCSEAMLESISRLVSGMLRAGVPASVVVRKLENIRCNNGGWNDGHYTQSCADAIAQALRMELKKQVDRQEEQQVEQHPYVSVVEAKVPPTCHVCGTLCVDTYYSEQTAGPFYCQVCWEARRGDE